MDIYLDTFNEDKLYKDNVYDFLKDILVYDFNKKFN